MGAYFFQEENRRVKPPPTCGYSVDKSQSSWQRPLTYPHYPKDSDAYPAYLCLFFYTSLNKGKRFFGNWHPSGRL